MHDHDIAPSSGADDAEQEQEDAGGQGLSADSDGKKAGQRLANEQNHTNTDPEVGTPTHGWPLSLWGRYKRWKDDPFRQRAHWSDVATIGLTVTLVAVGVTQACIYDQQKRIMESSGHQTDQLIEAAEIQALASRRIQFATRRQVIAADRNAEAAAAFAVSTEGIKKDTDKAVAQFTALANATQTSVEITKNDQRAGWS